tara:strand:- start:256 stop:945 length:690 start_codon:yes stop_codon:yes gene_type:complete
MVWYVKKLYLFLILFIRKVLKITLILDLIDRYKFIKKSYLRSLLSIHNIEELIDNDLLWINYNSINYLKKFVSKKKIVLEYGSGASSAWFSKRFKKLISIEHDELFYSKLKKIKKKKKLKFKYFLTKPQNKIDKYGSKRIKNFSFKNYIFKPNTLGIKFDVIFIDGRSRIECLKNSLYLVKKKGVIVFDNSDRKEYKNYLDSLKFKKKVFKGLCPGLPFKSETTFFFKA